MSNLGKCPCKGCDKRSEGCHSQCDEYRAFRKENIEKNKELFAKSEIKAAVVTSNINRSKRHGRDMFSTHRNRGISR